MQKKFDFIVQFGQLKHPLSKAYREKLTIETQIAIPTWNINNFPPLIAFSCNKFAIKHTVACWQRNFTSTSRIITVTMAQKYKVIMNLDIVPT